jgi:hypothetical protein
MEAVQDKCLLPIAALHGALTREQSGLLDRVFAGEAVERLGNILQWIATVRAGSFGHPAHLPARLQIRAAQAPSVASAIAP